MSQRDWKVRIDDILTAIARIQQYTHGLNKDEFAGSDLVVDAVIHNFTVIGEAARHIPAEVAARYPELPLADMRGMRNKIVHGYFVVDSNILWNTIRNDLPPLVPILREMLEREA
jgi:uncharacterized protein with HEPN domain